MRALRSHVSQQTWTGGWTQGWPGVPHTTVLGTADGAKVHKDSVCDASLQTPFRVAYYSRTQHIELFITFLIYIYLSTNVFNLLQGMP